MALPARGQSQALLEPYIQNENLRQHCYMVAQAMEAYATKLGADSELWYQTGLLHDLDWEKYPDAHPNKAISEILTEYPQEMLDAIAGHAPERTGVEPESQLARYLYACDELSGFLNAVSLMRPEGFAGMKPKSVKKKLKDKSFAAGVNRDDIAKGIELIEVELDEHIAFLIKVFETK
ncbi:MAG: HDIG domain-containing metalloprotein [Patescibacteria group bacterium]